MRINCHAHIFNLPLILTHETIETIVNRLRQSVPGFVADAVEALLLSLLEHPRYLDEEELLRLLLGKIGASAAFKKAAKALPNPVPEFALLGGVLDDLPLQALQGILDRLSTHFDEKDTAKGGIFDIFQTLRIALKPSVTAVADELLKEMQPGDGLVALMMDITSENEPDHDRRNFER